MDMQMVQILRSKGKGAGGELSPCRFKHDRATARKQRRCFACGQTGGALSRAVSISGSSKSAVGRQFLRLIVTLHHLRGEPKGRR